MAKSSWFEEMPIGGGVALALVIDCKAFWTVFFRNDWTNSSWFSVSMGTISLAISNSFKASLK